MISPALSTFQEGSRGTIASGRSEFHEWTIKPSPLWGCELWINGDLQSTERDQRLYHESLLAAAWPRLRREVRRVLLLGLGPGGSLPPLLAAFPSASVLAVDLDRVLVEAILPHLAAWHRRLVDLPQVELLWADASKIVAKLPSGSLDLIIVDLTDPGTDFNAAPIGTPDFWSNLARILAPGGAVAAQAGNPAGSGPGDLESVLRPARCAFDATIHESFIPSFECTWAFLGATVRGSAS